MERDRRDSASSTDSWSVIENRVSNHSDCSSNISDDDLVLTGTMYVDSDIEVAEEAYDSYDSDIEVHEESDMSESEGEEERADIEEERDSEQEEEGEAKGDKERDSEDDEESADIDERESEGEEETADTTDGEESAEEEEESDEEEEKVWCPVEHEDIGNEGIRYVPPENIKKQLNRLDDHLNPSFLGDRAGIFYLAMSFYGIAVTGLVLVHLIIVTAPIFSERSSVYDNAGILVGLQYPTGMPLPTYEEWKAQQPKVYAPPSPSPRLPYFNVTLLDEIRSLRRTRRILEGYVDPVPSEYLHKMLFPSVPFSVRPTQIVSPAPEVVNNTPATPEDLLCFVSPKKSTVLPALPLPSIFSVKPHIVNVPPFSLIALPEVPSMNVIQQNISLPPFFKISKLNGETYCQKLETGVPVKSIQSSQHVRARSIQVAPTTSVRFAPVPPPSKVRHQPSKLYGKPMAPVKKMGPCVEINPTPEFASKKTYGFSPKKDVTVSTSLNIVPTKKALLTPKPKTRLPFVIRRALGEFMNYSSFDGIAFVADHVRASSKASQLMRKKVRSQPRQCYKRELKTKYKFVSEKRRIAYKQPVPCSAKYSIETSLTCRKPSSLTLGKSFKKFSENKKSFKKPSKKADHKKSRRATKNASTPNWVFARSRGRAQFRKL